MQKYNRNLTITDKRMKNGLGTRDEGLEKPKTQNQKPQTKP